MTSELPGFYRLSMRDRRARIAALTGLDERDVSLLAPGTGLGEEHAERMVENALGVHGLPLGVCVNMRLDGREVLIPMAIEEPSVIAAASYAAKLLRAGGGVVSEVSEPICIGQIQVLDVPDLEAAERALDAASAELIEKANAGHPSLVAAGGGAIALEVRHLPRENGDPCGPMLVVHLHVDVRDAMGANAINSMCERLAPRVSELTGGRVGLRILSNLTDRRVVRVTGRVPFAALDGQGAESGADLASRIEEASVFAERDPYRACTHNKGIMNGVDAVLIALGQDFRAVEAGAHAYAARTGRYGALATWRAEDGALVGRLEMPLAVGTVGGVYKVHPVVQASRKIAKVETTAELAAMTASAGLAQNLGAIRALAAEGIQSGHMRLHARNVVVEAGARPDEVEAVATLIADRKQVNLRAAHEALAEVRKAARGPIVIDLAARRPVRRPPTPPSPVARASSSSTSTTVSAAPSGRGNEVSAMDSKNGQHPERELRGKIFVTGASGHLGANLVRRLLDDGHELRVLLRDANDTAAVDGLDVEVVVGDVRDASRMREVMRGCSYAFHPAALVSTVNASPTLEREIFEINVLGTRNVLRGAMDAGMERVVVTGSFSAVGYDLDDRSRPGCEEMPFYPFEDVLPYARSKQQCEHETWLAGAQGLDVVVVTSCAILGPHDYKPSRMGKTLLDFAKGELAAYIPGGFSFVAARDICEGHVLGMKRGRKGHKYIVASEFLTLDDIMDIFEEVTGRRRPRLRLPAPVMAGVAEVSSFFLNNFFPNAPQRLTPHAVRILRKHRHADTTLARTELGFEPTSIRHAVHEAYEDFARRGLARGRRKAPYAASPPKPSAAPKTQPHAKSEPAPKTSSGAARATGS